MVWNLEAIINVTNVLSPSLVSPKVVYKDGAVMDMSGFIFAVGNQDHPAATVGANPKAANLNQTTIAKLKLTEVES